MNIEKEYKATVVGINKYMNYKDDMQMKVVLKHQRFKTVQSVWKETEK